MMTKSKRPNHQVNHQVNHQFCTIGDEGDEGVETKTDFDVAARGYSQKNSMARDKK